MENETSIKIGRGWVKNVRAWPFPFTQQPLTIQLRIDLFLAHAISPDNIKWHISFSLCLYTTPASLSPLQEVIALQITIHSPFCLTLYTLLSFSCILTIQILSICSFFLGFIFFLPPLCLIGTDWKVVIVGNRWTNCHHQTKTASLPFGQMLTNARRRKCCSFLSFLPSVPSLQWAFTRLLTGIMWTKKHKHLSSASSISLPLLAMPGSFLWLSLLQVQG